MEYVPTAPESLPTAIASRARASRSRSRRTCIAHSASLTPNVVGSAWMPCVRPDHRRVAELACPGRDRRLELRGRGQDAVERPRHLQRERGVDDVARREPVVHPRAGGLPDAFLHDVDERGDVVVGDLLALVHRVDVERRPRSRTGARVVVGHDAELGPRFDREHLDLEPRAEARLVGEQVGDLGERVAGDHGSAWAAMSRR